MNFVFFLCSLFVVPSNSAKSGRDWGNIFFASELFGNLLIEPGSGTGPGSLGASFRDSQQFGRLVIRRSHEETELDELGRHGIPFGQAS